MTVTTFFFIFILSLSLIFYFIGKYSKFYIEGTKNIKLFLILILSFYLRIQLLLIRNSFIILIFSWEGLGLTSFFLVLFYYNWNSCQGASLTVLANRWGDAFIIRSIIIIFKEINYFIIFMLITIILSKRAIFPFSSWLPAAMAAPTPVSALVHSRTLVTAGVVLRFKYKISYLTLTIRSVLMILSTITIVLGSIRALIRIDLKKLVAYTTLSQIGFLIFSINSISPVTTLIYLLIHAFLKLRLFMMRGVSIILCRSQNLNKIIKGQNKFRFICIIYIICLNFFSWFCLSIYVIKESLINLIFKLKISWWLLQVIIIVLILTCCYSFRLVYLIFKIFRIKIYQNFSTQNIWLLMVVILLIFLKFTYFYIKNLKNFSLISINFLVITLFSFLFTAILPLIRVYFLFKLNTIFSFFFFFKIWERMLLIFQFKMLIVPTKIINNIKYITFIIIILMLMI